MLGVFMCHFAFRHASARPCTLCHRRSQSIRDYPEQGQYHAV
jgi:hypothetical protein